MERRLCLNFRRQVFLIYREIMHNILKHSKAERVEVSFTLRKDILTLHVADNGIGFNPDKGRRGNGLNNMTQRAEELKGRVDFQPRTGRGTAIQLDVPVT